MSCASWLRLLLVVSIAGLGGGLLRASDERAAAPDAQKDSEGREPVQNIAKKSPEEIEGNGAAIRKALLTKTKVDATAVPLEEFLNKLAGEHGLPLLIDKGAFADEGVQLDHPVTLQLADVTLRSALALILDPLQLTWVIEDEVLKVTSAANAAERLETRVYDVRKLVSRGEFSDLMEAITACVQPDSWEEAEGPASIGECRSAQAIVLRASAAVRLSLHRRLRILHRNIGGVDSRSRGPRKLEAGRRRGNAIRSAHINRYPANPRSP